MRRLLALALAAQLGLGCAAWRGVTGWFADSGPAQAEPDPSQGLTEVSSAELSDFFVYAHGFYSRLPLRRFNDRDTFMDPKLGSYFRTESAYADYYANLTGALRFARFKRLRPLSVEILEVRAEGPGKAAVVIRLVGDNSRPLRWTDVELVREDKWERVGERWWISPSRI
jgi:hypothetical protein